ncbi:MAG: hypothetical protein ACHQ53_01105 [Polyangiales bacterium]
MGVVRAWRWLLAICLVAACAGTGKPTAGSPGLEPPAMRSPQPTSEDAGMSKSTDFGNQGAGTSTGTGGATSPAGMTPGANATGGTGGSNGLGAAGAAGTPSTGSVAPEDDAGTVAH